MRKHRRSPSLLRGQFVRVRSEHEIAATLDAQGKLDGMPFMPEMARHCGKVFRIFRRAGKTCVEGHGLRGLESAILLEDLRCDGAFHDGCQRNCLMFWKEAWLERVQSTKHSPTPGEPPPGWIQQLPTRNAGRYLCQSTELHQATHPLRRWDIFHFFVEIRDGELSLKDFFVIVGHTLAERIGALFGAKRIGLLSGKEEKPSRGSLHLQAGEWVEVKSAQEIKRTLDADGKNRGLSFEPNMAEFIGGRYQVDFPIQRIILEQTGQMIPLTHTVALKNVACAGLCTKNCPRNNTLYWREAWLKRVEEGE